MPPPKPPQSPARRVGRYWAAILAPPYLLALFLLRERYPGGFPFHLASAAGFLAFAYSLSAYLLARRGTGRVPDAGPLFVWGGAAALQIHAMVPEVARTRTVPAALFFTVGCGVSPSLSVPAMIGIAGWLVAMSPRSESSYGEMSSIAAMLLLSGTAGILVRRKLRRKEAGEAGGRDAIDRSRALVLPWEEPSEGGRRPPEEAAEEDVLLRRELELKEGVRHALEGLLPLTGAAHVAYLSQSRAPGTDRHDGFLVSRGEEGSREFSVPDTCVPVREATVFRRPFLEDGPEAQRYAAWKIGNGCAPTGIAAAPVFRESAVEGVLLAVREEEGPWKDPVLPLLGLVAYFVGREIDRIRALQREDRYFLREDGYHRMVRKMAQVGVPGEGDTGGGLRSRRERVYAEAVGQIRRQIGGDRVLLVGTSDGGKKGWITWEESDSGAGGSEHPQLLGDSYVGWVIRTGSQRIFSDGSGPPRNHGILPPAWEKPGERSFLVLPVAGAGGFRGAVVCAHREPERFQRRHAEVVRDVTEVMQMGLSHVERLEALTKKATTDGLTGLANRRSFMEQLSGDLARMDGRHPCAVVMMDVDHFKRINDTYGHPFGDEVLKRMAGVLGKAVRKGDSAGRYGGEEFVLYLHMADMDHAREAAERFRRMIRQTKFQHEGREVVVTASFGVACAPLHGTTPEDLLKRADLALYLSKQRGRDRVTVWEGNAPTAV